MSTQKTYYTKQGLQELKEKINILEKQERPQLVKKMRDARSKGDLKENAEYHASKEEIALIDMRINSLKKELASAQIIDTTQIDTSKVSILTTVTLKNQTTGRQLTYQLVSSSEVDIQKGKISIDSPIAKGLLGKKKGEKTTISIPAGDITFEIVDITL